MTHIDSRNSLAAGSRANNRGWRPSANQHEQRLKSINMSITTESQPKTEESDVEEIGGLIAGFETARDVKLAAKAVRAAGYRNFEVYSPHPIHGLDDILKAKRPLLAYAAIVGAVTGLAGGMWIAWWMNAVDYPFIISGKPLFSVLPSLPVAFELAILLAAFAVFGGTIFLGGMPQPANRLFRVPGFGRATNDRFFLAIDRDDPEFDSVRTNDFLAQLDCMGVESIPIDSPNEAKLPRPLLMVAAVLGTLALVPPVMIAKARTTTSTTPRLSIISDMDYQPKFKAQTTNSLFADGRSMRPQVSGTVARGDLREDDAYYRGILSEAESGGVEQAGASGLRLIPVVADDELLPNYTTELPLPVDEALIRRGKERYEIYCATCHGQGGDGDGLVTLRALELEQGTWVKPTSLHAELIRQQPVGQLYNTIANGVRKMPSYASQIPVRDRWAIVAYLKALQKTRTATADDVPADVLSNMRELN